jgi:hypothetical protein
MGGAGARGSCGIGGHCGGGVWWIVVWYGVWTNHWTPTSWFGEYVDIIMNDTTACASLARMQLALRTIYNYGERSSYERFATTVKGRAWMIC